MQYIYVQGCFLPTKPNRFFYPTTSAVPPVFFLITYPTEIYTNSVVTDSERETKVAQKSRYDRRPIK